MRKSYRISVFLFVLLIAVSALACSFAFAGHSVARVNAAAADVYDFSRTDVMTDLNSATLNGVKFDVKDYPTKAGAPIKPIQFVEFGYSFNPLNRGQYSLFIYLYNPGLWNISTGNLQNRIQMGSLYGPQGTPGLYTKFPVKFLSRSGGDIEGLFYKFQIVFSAAERESLLNRLNTFSRRYDFSGIELVIGKAHNATDFHIGWSITATGFAKGFGSNPNAQSTLETAVVGLQTVSLEVKNTFWRSRTSSRGFGFQNQIDSVYFSVPNELLERYGRLQKIMAEWWEYKTQPIIVTKDRDIYNKLSPKIGQYVNKDKSLKYGLYEGYSERGGGSEPRQWYANWFWNEINESRPEQVGASPMPNQAFYLYYMFFVNNIEHYDPNGINTPIGAIGGKDLADYIYNYNKSFAKGTLPIKDGQISADLFTDTIDSNRAAKGFSRGYNLFETDYGDTFDFFSYMDTNSKSVDYRYRQYNFWTALFGGGKIPAVVTDDTGRQNVLPIYQLTDADFVGADIDIGNNLLVREQDVQSLKTYYNQAKVKNETTFLFRFAQTDYYTNWVAVVDDSKNHNTWYDALFGWLGDFHPNYITDDKAYFAQETVFLDFDVIQLTFKGDVGQYVIPVVSNPIDIVNDITPPLLPPRDPTVKSWWWLLWLILGLIALFFILAILAPFFPLISLIFTTLLNILLFPFRVLRDVIKNRRKRKRRIKNEKGY